MNRAAHASSRPKAVDSDPRSLTLPWVLAELVKAELIAPQAAAQISAVPGAKAGETPHPLVVVAAQDWPDRRTEGQKLSLEVLTRWLALAHISPICGSTR
jgi:hypothetical protein